MEKDAMIMDIEKVIDCEKRKAFELLAQGRMLEGEGKFFTSLGTVFTCHEDVSELLLKVANLNTSSKPVGRFKEEIIVILTSLLVAFVDRDLMHKMYMDCVEHAIAGFTAKRERERKLKETQEQKDNSSINGKGEEVLKEFSA